MIALSRLVCFVTIFFGLCLVWPRVHEGAPSLLQAFGWTTVLGTDLLITAIAMGAVRLTNVNFRGALPARIAVAILMAFAGLVGVGLLSGFWATFFIGLAFPYPLVAVPILFLGDFYKREAADVASRPWLPDRRQAIIVALPAVFLSIFGFYLLFEEYAPTELAFRSQFRTGNDAVRRVEAYRRKSGRVPESLRQVGFEKDDPDNVSYEKCSDTEYNLGFMIDFDHAMTFDQKARDWERRNIPCGSRENRK